MGVSVLIACGATWWFLKDNGLPTGEPISEAVMAEDGLAEEINPSEEQGTETQAVVESDADVTFSLLKKWRVLMMEPVLSRTTSTDCSASQPKVLSDGN